MFSFVLKLSKHLGFASRDNRVFKCDFLKIYFLRFWCTVAHKAQSPVRKKSAKCEKVRAKYVLGMRSDLLLGFLAKNFSAKKS